MATKPTLYALLVGVDAYQYPVRPLSGCVNDMLKFKKYLEDNESNRFHLQIDVLLNEKAVKAQIVKRFEQHLGQAGSGDVALFYYSGHGAQEKADPTLWRFEPDGMLEGLVCFDSIPASIPNYNLLCDKELRYLIHRVAHGSSKKPKPAPPHVLTIFDCCHAGGNTRNAFIFKESRAVRERRFKPMAPRQGEARMGSVLPARPWNQFIFSKEINVEDLKTKPLSEVLPEGRHIQLAACQSDESAYESGGSGVFSRNLIDVLQRSEGSITYFDLKNRLRYFIKNQFQQSPQIEGGGGSVYAEDVYKGFLDHTPVSRPLYGNVVYNPKLGWVMDLGAMHGISAQADGIRVTEVGKEVGYTASIRSITQAETLLGFDPAVEAQLSRDKALYRGYVDGFRSAPIRIFVQSDGDEQAARALQDALKSTEDNLSIAMKEREADYRVSLKAGRYVIMHPGTPDRPLVYPEAGFTQDALRETVHNLRHIAQWEYVKCLQNEGQNRLSPDAVSVLIYRALQDGTSKLLDIKQDEVHAEFEAGSFGGRPYGGNVRIQVVNRSKFPVYASLLYLSNTFEVFGDLLPGKVVKLEPMSSNGNAWVFDGGNAGLLYERAVEVFNHPESVSYFKLIFSQQEFSIDALEQNALRDPAELLERNRGWDKGITRPPKNADSDAWGTRLIALRIPNPRFNQITAAERKAWKKTGAAPWIR